MVGGMVGGQSAEALSNDPEGVRGVIFNAWCLAALSTRAGRHHQHRNQVAVVASEIHAG